MWRDAAAFVGVFSARTIAATFNLANNVKNVFSPSPLTKRGPRRPFSAELNSHYFPLKNKLAFITAQRSRKKTLLQ